MPEAGEPDLAALQMRAEVELFLFREAELLDSGALDEWIELFADDATYWVPSGSDDIDPAHEVSIVYDRLPQLRERVWRMQSGVAHAQEPPSRTVHAVGNVTVASDGDVVDATSTFTVAEFRRGRQHLHAGRYRHRLRRAERGLVIVSKKAELVNNDGFLGNLSILL